MDYFEQLHQGGPGYEVRDLGPGSFGIYCRDENNDREVLAFQPIVHAAKANESGDWKVGLAPSGGYKIRSIPGWQDRVYMMATITKQSL